MSKLKSDKLFLLEKLVQSSSDGEVTTEQRDLFVNLVKETSPNSPNMRKKSANAADRNSRQRVKVRSNSHEVEDINHGKVQIPLPETENRSRSRSRSSGSRSRSGSSSSFWSSGSQDRARIRKTSSGSRSPSHSSSGTYSRSRSGSRSRSQSRSCSRSGSSSRSRSRSRSPSMEYSRNKIRERSKSPPVSRSLGKEPRSGSLSSTQSAPTKPLVQKQLKKSRDSASDSGRNDKHDKGKRKKLLKRGEVRKYRSFDINPDVFIEERLKQKYKELNNLLASQFTGSQLQMTHQQFQQMQNLRTQYISASHGLPPSGVLIPRSLPHDMRVKRGAPQGLTKRRSKSRDTLNSDFGEDHTYVSVQRVLNTTAAREGRVIVDPHPVSIKKKKKVKKTDSNTKLNSTLDSNSDHTGSRTLSPRSRIEIHHLKDTENPDLLKWLKQKDKEHRKKEKEERRKRREEREKLVLEANEKFERRLESQKIVKKWRTEKEKEYRKILKEKKNQEKEAEIQQKAKMEMSLPGKSMVVRPQTAPLEWKRKTDSSTPKIKKEKERKEEVSKKTTVKAQTVQDQLGTSSAHLKFDLNDHQNNDQLPPTSKFMYKRPVAGKIKLNMRNRPMSAQPKLQTTNNLESETSRSVQEGNDRNSRMSYDDWVNTKRKQDQEKRKREKMRQKEELSKSDPEIAKLVPDIAKKRIHNILNERKSIDTGIKHYDETVNNSFGGGSFDRSKSPNVTMKTNAYKWADDRPATAKDRTVESLKVSGKSYQRPGTAPSGGRKVPVPMRSPYSPVPAHTPARVEEILNNDDQTNPFKLPFPAEEGVPKHVAAMQKKLFSDENFKKNERLEPQNGGSSLDIVPSTSAVARNASTMEDIKYDNITAIDQSSNVQHDEKKDYKTDEKKDHRTEDQKNRKVGEKEKNIGEELHSRLTAHVENTNKIREFDQMNNKPEMGKNDVNRTEETAKKLDESFNLNKESEGFKQLIESDENSDTSLPEELTYENSENSNEKVENEQNAVDEVDSKHEINYKVRENDNENNLNQSAKHVSFCEEPEVFIDPDGPDWSTDTGTPDEDNSRYTTKEDLSKLIDSCGELLNSEYGDQNDDDKAFLTESLDEDF